MTKAQRRMQFHENFETMVHIINDLMPRDQRSQEQQQFVDDVDFQLRVLRTGQFRLEPTPIRIIQRKKARHQRMLDELIEALRTGQAIFRKL